MNHPNAYRALLGVAVFLAVLAGAITVLLSIGFVTGELDHDETLDLARVAAPILGLLALATGGLVLWRRTPVES